VLALQVGQAASVAPVANASSLTLANPVWTISPALPAGLSLDPGTGAIHGTPAGPAGSGHYTVTFAFSYDLGGGAGQAICDLWITVS